jgi:class 3 adenylate cyclase
MSSSTSGQWMRRPSEISWKFFLSRALASISLGNHSRGALSSRPSARRTVSQSLDTLTSAARASLGLGRGAMTPPTIETLGGVRPVHPTDRVLATVLFTDIVESTRKAAELGDHAWHELLAKHDRLARRVVSEGSGRVIKSTGDGILATFDGPARGVHAAQELTVRARELDLPIRAGLHAGEVEVSDDDVAGLAVHIGARVANLASANEVLVTSTVKELVIGSQIDFEDRGSRVLKGVPGRWRLFAVTNP